MSQFQRSDYDNYLFPNYAPLEKMPVRGEGARLWANDGKEYIDFSAGIAVSALGHCHPELVAALTEQAQQYWHVSNLLTTEPAIELAKQLTENTFAERAILLNSGAEANEAALKLARRYAVDHFSEDKDEIIAFDNSFHGRTFFTVCVGGQAQYSNGFGPKPGGITHLPFNDIQALEGAISDRICAVILEPVQGEGGVNPANLDFVKSARELCDRHQALLIFDEVQTGVMRTGDLYAYQGLGVTPDILTTGKGLGAGFPISACLTSAKIAASMVVGTHGSTFGGNPLGCAVANKVLDLVNTDAMREQVKTKGKAIKQGITQLNEKYGLFQDIRGEGLLIGCELTPEHAGKARDLIMAMLDNGLMAMVAGPDVVRLAPPLVLTEQDITDGLAAFELGVEQYFAAA